MNRLQKLRQTLADLKAEGTALVEAAEKDDRAMTEDETERFGAIEAQIEEVNGQIASAERLAEQRRTMEAVTGTSGSQRITVNDPNPATTGGFKDIAEFASAVHGAVQSTKGLGGQIDPRLAATPTGTQSGGGDAGEGYALPPQFRDDVWELITEFDEFGGLIDEEPTSRREVKIMADDTTPWGTSGIKSYWRREGSKMTATELADEGRNVPLHELYTLALATDELLEDAPRLGNRVTRQAARAIAWKKNAAIVEGTGVGQPLGWMNSGALVTVAKENGQTDDTVTAANIVKMYSRLQAVPGDRPFWLVHRTVLPQLVTMTIGDRPIYVPPQGFAEAPFGTLMGLPVRVSEFAEELGDKGDVQLISPMGYYAARRSAGVNFASSIHLYFDYGIQAFRWTFRYGGQPHLSAPVAAAKGSVTSSHFVTLAARGS